MISAPKTLKILLKVQKWPQKASKNLSSRDMSNLHFSQNSENSKFKSDSPLEKILGYFSTEKASQPPQKRSVFSKKNGIKKQRFQIQKHEKYLESKNGLKRLLQAFNQEL